MRLGELAKNLQNLPRNLRTAVLYVGAVQDVSRNDYLKAERKLLGIYAHSPAGEDPRPVITVLMSLVNLRLGHFIVSSEFALNAINQLWTRKANLRRDERGYLLYYVKGLYERATYLSGEAKTIDVKVKYEDIDLTTIRPWLSDTFPLTAPGDHVSGELH
jgi:hypothetical protein